jgi:hypothetical protein
VTCHYRRPTIDRILTELPLPKLTGAIITCGRGVLETGIAGETKHPLLKMKVAEMRDATTGKSYLTRWDVTTGREYILEPQTQLTIRAVTKGLTGANIDTFCKSWVGYTASGTSPITGVTAANLLCAGVRIGRHPANAALQMAEFVFLYDTDGWQIDYVQKIAAMEVEYPPTVEVGFTAIVGTAQSDVTVAKGGTDMSQLAALLNESQWTTTWA